MRRRTCASAREARASRIAPCCARSATACAPLVDALQLCYRSLCDTGQKIIANGRLLDVLRRISAFGLTLVRLDLRQHSARHLGAIDAITRHLGLGSYAQWNE